MAVDYKDAAKRHFEDGQVLFNKNRLANADHLFGLAAECALKSVMYAHGMALRPNGVPVERDHRKHINGIWKEFQTFAAGRNMVRYAASIQENSNPFDNWDVSQRYENQSQFVIGEVREHKMAAELTIRILQDAILDGVVL